MTAGLARFVEAQAPVIDQALEELRAGRKRSHWMWFVFPQIAGLGVSPTSRRFAITDLAEARAYLAHPSLGPRLETCTEAVNTHRGKSAHDIFGWPDDLKFHSSMTLFAAAAPEHPSFATALGQFFEARPDPRTLEILRG